MHGANSTCKGTMRSKKNTPENGGVYRDSQKARLLLKLSVFVFEFINSSSRIDQFRFTGVEWM